MNNTQLVILWIGALVFLLCLWNPKIIPYTGYEPKWIQPSYTDEEKEQLVKEKEEHLIRWDKALSRYNLSLNDVNVNTMTIDGVYRSDRLLRACYLDTLKKSEVSPKKEECILVPVRSYKRPFKNDPYALFIRLATVIIPTTLLLYTFSDRHKARRKNG